MRLLRLLTLALVGAALSFPAAFTTGNLVVLRFGDGSAALASSGTAAFLDEYTPAGALVQSIALPTSVNGSNKRLVVSGTATTEGQMSLSTDGKCLVVPGYDAAVGTASITTSTSATVNRVIGKINSSGVIDTTTALTDAITGGNPRAATSTNCTDLWIAGSTAGVRYAAAGATTSTSVSTTSTNIRGLNIFGGQLYASTASGTLRIGTVGTGTPTTTGQTYTNLPGFPTATVTPNAFFFADLNAGVAGVDTLYFVDESLGIQKYSLVSGSWTSNGSIAAATARGLTASVSGSTVTLYVTYGTGAKLAKLVDSGGYNTAITGTLTDLATAGTNTQFRGVAFAPQSGLPSLSINDVSQNEGDAGTTAFTFTVSLSAPAGPAGVTFDIATADNTATSPSDYTANSLTSQTILAGNSTYSFTVLVNGDTTLEPNETFFVNITNVTGASVSDGQGLGTIVNDEPVTTSPTGTGSATPSTVTLGNSTLLKVAVTPGANPTSTGITVTADLSSIGGSAGQTFFDNGTNGDVTAGDNIFSFQATTSGATGPKTLPVSIADGQTRTGTTSISLTVTPSSLPPSGTGLANPNTLQAGSSTLLTVAVTSGTNPASTGLAVTADLTTIGGSATQQFFDDGTHGDLTPGDNTFSFSATVTATPGAKNLPVTITDAQARTGSASIALTIQSPPAPRTLKISQVYGGGGNSGTTYKNDFIEIFNQSNSPVDVTGWSIQHASAVVTTAWNVTPLCPTGPCVIQPYRYFLVGEAAGAGGTTDLPPPDVTGTINMGNATGKAALVNNTTAISGDCPTSTSIADLVGYGSNCHEIPIGGGGGAAPSLDNQSAAVRKGNGCVDTDDNAADFIKLGPIPRNSSAPANVCGGDPTKPSGVGTATPSTLEATAITLLIVTVTPASAPPSTGITVTGDLTTLGASATQQFYDDGTHGDVTPGDNVFSFSVATPSTTGAKYIPTTIADAQSRTAPAPITITVSSPTCGVERWSVKTGTDPDAGLVNLNSPVRTTISSLRGITAPVDPPGPPLNARVQPTETTVWVVNGLLTLYKLEDDVDYHIVIQDPNGNTMITEMPSPACDGSTSPFDAMVAAVRAKFNTRFTPNSFFQTANIPVQMKGIGFFDFLHGQTGVAPNGIELHPLLEINFTAPTTTVISSNLNPATFGQTVTLTATVGTGTAAIPTGTVTFFDGSTTLGTAVLDNTGHANFTTSALPAGARIITASYEGDSAAAESKSASFTQFTNGGSPANIIPTKTLARVGGQIVVTVTFTNNGGTTAQNVMLTVAKIGTTVPTTSLPVSLGAIAPGASIQTVVNFPGTVGASGAASSLTLSGTYTGGTFATTARITLP